MAVYSIIPLGPAGSARRMSAVKSGGDIRQVPVRNFMEVGAHAASAGSAGSGRFFQTVVYELGMIRAGRCPLCTACMLRPPAPELRGSKFVRTPLCVCRIRAAAPLRIAANNIGCCSTLPGVIYGISSGNAQLSNSV